MELENKYRQRVKNIGRSRHINLDILLNLSNFNKF